MARRSLQARFGRAVRLARDGVGVSQEALADQAGIHRTYLSLIERGVGNPTLTVIEELARALGTQPSELLKRARA